MNFVAFPSIEGFHHIVKYVTAFPDVIKEPVQYRGKVKLHGTNAGIRIFKGEVVAQSRTQLIDPKNDNAGFARWVESCSAYWAGIGIEDGVVFGEWCGQGIMKGTAINQIGKKVFAVFAIFAGDKLIADPEAIEALLGPVTGNEVQPSDERPHNVYVLPWHGEAFVIDYCSQSSMRETVPNLNVVVENVEQCDPWVKKVFGVEGIGEGVVYYPQTEKVEMFNNLAFKAKGEKHRVAHTKEAVQMAPEVAQNISDFVTMFVTEPRCEQGLAAIGGDALMPKMKDYLQWMMADIAKESKDELEASGMTFEQVQKATLTSCREWFIKKSRTI